MVDVLSTSLDAEDKEILAHPLVGGLILFTRNYHSPEQINELTAQIRAAAKKPLLIAVDHEGGRVQRFRQGYSAIPAMADIYRASNENMKHAAEFAKSAGYLMASEVIASGIDISFAPVLDVNGISEVIGNRAFHQEPEIVTRLAKSFIHGMNETGMKATGKHFPGHGSVKEDSHIALPIDKRSQADIYQNDLLPFQQLIKEQLLSALMPAHIIFPAIDDEAVGFSRKWLQQILRAELGFNGVIFSDDLSMQGAAVVGGYVERAEAAQQAGCDMLLTCNNRAAAIDVIDNANIEIKRDSQQRLQAMLSQSRLLGRWSQRTADPQWQLAKKQNEKIHEALAV